MPNNCCVNSIVIASAAKQSRRHSARPLDCFVARAPRNDGQASPSRLSLFLASPHLSRIHGSAATRVGSDDGDGSVAPERHVLKPVIIDTISFLSVLVVSRMPICLPLRSTQIRSERRNT